MKKDSFLLLVTLVLFLSGTARALEEKDVPPELDFFRRGARVGHFEIPIEAGEYFADKFDHSFLLGTGLYYTPLPPLSIGVDFGYGWMSFDPTSRFGQAMTDDKMMLLHGVVRLALPGAYRSKKAIKEVDFYTTLGGGLTRLGDANRGTGFIGGGMKMYTKWDWLATRVEVRNYFMTVPTTTGDKFAADLVVTAGPVFQLPPFMD
ncbi:MAG: hypothetical protein Q7S00_07700 [bacterium]|nr:hypothetical protein [bacterium]